MRTVVVTGSASGVGAAVRRRLERDRCRVIGIDISDTEVVADLSTGAGRSKAMNTVIELSRGCIDGLVVSAGLPPHVEDRSMMVAVNYYGAVELLDGLRPALAAGTGPSAVVVASNAVTVVPVRDTRLVDALLDGDEARALEAAGECDGPTAHAMTQLALVRAVRRRVSRWGRAGVRLNAVAPGPLRSPLFEVALDDPGAGDAALDDAGFDDAVVDGSPAMLPVPLERSAGSDDVAGPVCFLLGEDAAFVHGSLLFVDGGTDALVRPDWY